jgi:hypothetical protein
MPRLIWRFRPIGPGRLEASLGPEPLSTAPAGAPAVLARLKESVRFQAPPTPLSRTSPGGEALVEGLGLGNRIFAGADLYHALPEDLDEARKGLAILKDAPGEVEEAVLELEISPPKLARWVLPPFKQCQPSRKHAGPSRDWSRCQGYLDPAPGGLDARHAWTFSGGTGDGVSLLDLEIGFNRNHEDLGHVVAPASSVPNHIHGTMSLGVCCGNGANGFGVRGVAFQAAPQFDHVDRDLIVGVKYPLVSQALYDWIPRLPRGSVILLELAARCYDGGAFNGRWFPLEKSPDIRDAIAAAAKKPIYVIEPAGNGDVDLDAAGVSQPTAAIMVGGGTVPGGSRWGFGPNGSSYGSRVDVQGWAESVVTAGGPGGWADDLQRHVGADGADRCYTQSFNGTSSAAAMVAGAVACLSGILKANAIDPISPQDMKDLLVSTGTPQGKGPHIGPRPDLRKAIAQLEQDFGPLQRLAEAAA